MKIIFLDVDGELTYSEYENEETANIDIKKVQLLKEICDRTDARVVISSSWRGTETHTPHIYHVLRKILTDNGIEVIGDTPYISTIIKKQGKHMIIQSSTEPDEPQKSNNGSLNIQKRKNSLFWMMKIGDGANMDMKKNWVCPTWFGNGGIKREHVEQAVHILQHKDQEEQ